MNNWTKIHHSGVVKPEPRNGVSSVLLDEIIYIFGGFKFFFEKKVTMEKKG
jgi:hypothetical protein